MLQDKNKIPTYHAAALLSFEAGLQAIRRFKKVVIRYENERAEDYTKYQRSFAGAILDEIIDEVEALEENAEEYVITEQLVNKVVLREMKIESANAPKEEINEIFAFLVNVELAIETIQQPGNDNVVGIINLVTIGEVLKKNGQITTNAKGDSLRVFLSNEIRPWRKHIKELLLKDDYKAKWFQLRKLTTFKKIIAESAAGKAEKN